LIALAKGAPWPAVAVAPGGGWWLAASMALALAALLLRDGRRRAAINEALHELRRPLQAIALAAGAEGSTRLAATALERLERAVNGGSGPAARGTVRCDSVLRSAVGRWRQRVALEGGSLELRWWAGEAVVVGDRDGLERALDNLIVNAIEHGGPTIVVEGRHREGRLCVSVADSGRRQARERPSGALAFAGRRRWPSPGWLSGRRRRGHGLTVVRRVAAEHGGRFVLRHSARGALAVLELPLGRASAEPAG
jgi:K+-sensing histidine kinase KdpD